jgi:acyl-CoA reductase-like NAD-dependent aldehyde dehydrogenase
MAQAKTRTKATAEGPPMLKSFNPSTGEAMGEIPSNTPEEVREAVARARKVQPEWAAIPPPGRAHLLKAVRERIYERMDDIIDTVSKENGKPEAEALTHDVLPSVLFLAYLGRIAPKALRTRPTGRLIGPIAAGLRSEIQWHPYGVIGCIAPWNYPFQLSFMGMVPALLAGNTVVLKPSEFTPGVGERIREVLDVLPAGVATVVQGGGEVGAALVDAPVDKICFIGSGATGRRIAEAASKYLTPIVMELGGQDSAVVCADADLDQASSGVLWGSFLNNGQTCAAIERAYVVESVADEFEARLVEKLGRLRTQMADGDMGPLTIPRQLEVVQRHAEDAVDKGAKLLAGGPPEATVREDGSLFYPPTVIEGRTEEMAIWSEETFGPILPIIRVRDEEEAVRRANEEGYNLTASVWTRDKRKGHALASRIVAGNVGVNENGAVAAGLPWALWGGKGESGYGRLHGELGLREFSVPVVVHRKATGKMKSLWWFGYDEATTRTLRGAAELISAPTLAGKARAARMIAGNIVRAVRQKV